MAIRYNPLATLPATMDLQPLTAQAVNQRELALQQARQILQDTARMRIAAANALANTVMEGAGTQAKLISAGLSGLGEGLGGGLQERGRRKAREAESAAERQMRLDIEERRQAAETAREKDREAAADRRHAEDVAVERSRIAAGGGTGRGHVMRLEDQINGALAIGAAMGPDALAAFGRGPAPTPVNENTTVPLMGITPFGPRPAANIPLSDVAPELVGPMSKPVLQTILHAKLQGLQADNPGLTTPEQYDAVLSGRLLGETMTERMQMGPSDSQLVADANEMLKRLPGPEAGRGAWDYVNTALDRLRRNWFLAKSPTAKQQVGAVARSLANYATDNLNPKTGQLAWRPGQTSEGVDMGPAPKDLYTRPTSEPQIVLPTEPAPARLQLAPVDPAEAAAAARADYLRTVLGGY